MRIAANAEVGSDVRVVIRKASNGDAYDGADVVPFNVADIADYGITATDPDGIGEFSFRTEVDAPGLPDGSYYASFFTIADTGIGLQVSDAPAFASRNFTLSPAAAEAGDVETGDTVLSYEARLARIDTAIDNLLANPRPNYRVNGVSMDWGALLNTLQSMRDSLIKRLNGIPFEVQDAFQSEMSVFGEDFAQYHGDTP